MSLPNGTDTRTALALVVDSSELTSLRQQHDRAWPRWPNHINLLFPFVPVERFDEVHAKLTRALRGQPAIPISFDPTTVLDSFPQRNQTATFHLRVDSPEIQELYRRVRTTLGDVPVKHAKFSGHLTLGQGGPDVESTLHSSLAEAALPARRLTRLCLMSRVGQETFQIRAEILFGGEAEETAATAAAAAAVVDGSAASSFSSSSSLSGPAGSAAAAAAVAQPKPRAVEPAASSSSGTELAAAVATSA